jgi:hypothetical protein
VSLADAGGHAQHGLHLVGREVAGEGVLDELSRLGVVGGCRWLDRLIPYPRASLNVQ